MVKLSKLKKPIKTGGSGLMKGGAYVEYISYDYACSSFFHRLFIVSRPKRPKLPFGFRITFWSFVEAPNEGR